MSLITPTGHEHLFELSDAPPKIKGVSQGRSSAAAQRRRQAFTVRTFARLLGPMWVIDLTQEGLFFARKPFHPKSLGTVESFDTTYWYRPDKKSAPTADLGRPD